MSTWDAIGVGLVVRDVSVLLDRYPGPDEKLPAREIHEAGGGPVPTALVTLARFGRRTAIAATVGDDAVGRFIVSGLESEGVDTSAIRKRADFESPTSVILVEHGRRTILEPPKGVGFPIAWDDVRELPLDDCRALLVDARAVAVQIPAAETVRRAGGLVLLDCGHPREGVDDLVALSDIAIFSHTYPQAIHGPNYEVGEFLRDVRERLADGPGVVGVTLGADGCAVMSRKEPLVKLKPPEVRALDSTGAGDVFHGAFLHAYLDSGEIDRAARFANAAAAKKCEGMTGRAPLPPAEALWALT